MTKKQNTLKHQTSVYITPSLLNAWIYCLEGEFSNEKSYEELIKQIKKEPIDLSNNEAVQKGIAFEKECCDGLDKDISPIINGGIFQFKAHREAEIDGVNVLLYGILDVLKGGKIYDIKRVRLYEPGKYFTSMQHHFYLSFFTQNQVREFTYLIKDDELIFHHETYYNEGDSVHFEKCKKVVSDFFNWLKIHNLYDIFLDKWKQKGE